jgi:hypothetical protein
MTQEKAEDPRVSVGGTYDGERRPGRIVVFKAALSHRTKERPASRWVHGYERATTRGGFRCTPVSAHGLPCRHDKRILARCAASLAVDDQPGRSHAADPRGLAAVITAVRVVMVIITANRASDVAINITSEPPFRSIITPLRQGGTRHHAYTETDSGGTVLIDSASRSREFSVRT